MGEDTVDKAVALGKLPPKKSGSAKMTIHGQNPIRIFDDPLYVYGSDREYVLALITENQAWGDRLDDALDYLKAEVIWAARYELARTVEDILARRMRALFSMPAPQYEWHRKLQGSLPENSDMMICGSRSRYGNLKN